ncbi:BTAD domain-containing putative transcriptional regulator [Streptomyces inhibens]|uniref:AfsR/SARP family transcriptional regulator n=1 Tax=Streptomyces inhibens TaxID=2293571 RepID=UPI0036C5D9F6
MSATRGYLIEVEPQQLDALQFRELVHAGQAAERAGDVEGGGAGARRGGGPMAWPWPFPSWVRCRLSQPSHGAFESWAEAELALGRHTRVADGINEPARRHPFRERLRSTQMPARYRSGRRAEAPAFPTLTHRTGPGPVRGHAAAPGP